MFGLGVAPQGEAVWARQGQDRLGTARHGAAGQHRLGGSGSAWLGMAGLGTASQYRRRLAG